MRNGQILVLMSVYLTVVLITVAAFLSRTTNFLRFGSRSTNTEIATHVAEAGVDYAIQKLATNSGYAGENNKDIDPSTAFDGVFDVSVVSETWPLYIKTITSTGYIPNRTNPKAKKTIKVIGQPGKVVSFPYAIQTDKDSGDIGIAFSNNNNVVDGNVRTNGQITNIGTNSITGTATSSPQAGCSLSSPPVGLTVGYWNCVLTDESLPDITESDIKTEASKGKIWDCSLLPCTFNDGTQFLGYTGDTDSYGVVKGNLTLTTAGGGPCGTAGYITMQGPLWIQGNLTVNRGSGVCNLATINADNVFGSNTFPLIVEGQITINDAHVSPTNTTPPGNILFVSDFASTDCSSPSIQLQNVTPEFGKPIGGIYYAANGIICTNPGSYAVGIVAKKFQGNAAHITYDSGIASTNLLLGPNGPIHFKKGSYYQTKSP